MANRCRGLVPVGHTERGRILSNLGGLLDGRFEQTNDVENLREATGFHRQALAATRPGHSERGKRLSNLVISLIYQSRASNDDSVLDEALDRCHEALRAMPVGDSGRAQTLQALGGVYAQRYNLTGNHDVLDAGIKAFCEAADDRPRRPGSASRQAVTAGSWQDRLVRPAMRFALSHPRCGCWMRRPGSAWAARIRSGCSAG